MKNPTTQIDVFKITQGNNQEKIAISYSKNGVARAWYGYSDYCITYAGGYGYCKQSTVLANSIASMGQPKEKHDGYMFGVNFTIKNPESIRATGGGGWDAVASACNEQGILLQKIW